MGQDAGDDGGHRDLHSILVRANLRHLPQRGHRSPGARATQGPASASRCRPNAVWPCSFCDSPRALRLAIEDCRPNYVTQFLFATADCFHEVLRGMSGAEGAGSGFTREPPFAVRPDGTLARERPLAFGNPTRASRCEAAIGGRPRCSEAKLLANYLLVWWTWRPKIMRPALLCSMLVTMMSMSWPIRWLACSQTTIVPSSR